VDPYVSDEERWEAVKRWWKENGTTIVTGLLVGLLLIVGWRAWTGYRQDKIENATLRYEQLLLGLSQKRTKKNIKEVEKASRSLIQDYLGSPYAVDGALLLAKLKVETGALKEAISQLRWVLKNTDEDSYKNHLARLRLARLLRDEGKLGEALATLKVDDQGTYAVYYQYVQGTIYERQKKCEQAQAAYKGSIKGLVTTGSAKDRPDEWINQQKFKQLIEHKLENVTNC